MMNCSHSANDEFKVVDDDGNTVYPLECPPDLFSLSPEASKLWQKEMDAYMVFYHRAWKALPAAKLNIPPSRAAEVSADSESADEL